MTQSSDTLLCLLRYALGNEKESDNNIHGMNDAGWEEVMHIASRHGVAALAFDGIEKIYGGKPDGMAPELWTRWIANTLMMEQRHEKYRKVIEELSNLLREHGLTAMLLKGYGLSLNYPKPNHRPSGDIDIYSLGRHGEIDLIAERELNASICRDNPHHSIFTYHGFMIENHATILNVETKKANRKCEKLLCQIAEDCRNGKKGIVMPSAKFNSVHILRHMAGDFASAGTSLRHLTDWATFVNKNKENIDWEFVQTVAKANRMERFLDALNAICTEYLGFCSTDFPVYKQDDKLRDRVLSDILYPKFDDDVSSKDNIIRFGWVRTRRIWINRWKHNMVFDEPILRTYIRQSVSWVVRHYLKKTTH